MQFFHCAKPGPSFALPSNLHVAGSREPLATKIAAAIKTGQNERSFGRADVQVALLPQSPSGGNRPSCSPCQSLLCLAWRRASSEDWIIFQCPRPRRTMMSTVGESGRRAVCLVGVCFSVRKFRGTRRPGSASARHEHVWGAADPPRPHHLPHSHSHSHRSHCSRCSHQLRPRHSILCST